MSSDSADRLSELLVTQEDLLRGALAKARAKYAHPGDRGTGVEIAFREFLAEHLSRRLSVGQGEVIDLSGSKSRQLDVVIATDDQPFHDPPSEPGLFIVEGVYAVGEVKSVLTTGELADIIKKGKSVKNLQKPPLAVGAMAVATDSDGTRWIDGPPPFFAFAFETNVAVKTLLDRLRDVGEPTPVDAVFVLGKGTAINFGDGHGARRLRLDDGSPATGWAWMEGIPSLIELLGWLHALPRVQHMTSPFLPYLEKLTSKSDGVLVAVPSAEPRPPTPG
jgi:hypothetical protein